MVDAGSIASNAQTLARGNDDRGHAGKLRLHAVVLGERRDRADGHEGSEHGGDGERRALQRDMGLN